MSVIKRLTGNESESKQRTITDIKNANDVAVVDRRDVFDFLERRAYRTAYDTSKRVGGYQAASVGQAVGSPWIANR